MRPTQRASRMADKAKLTSSQPWQEASGQDGGLAVRQVKRSRDEVCDALNSNAFY